jgi:hypothetical protein
MGGVEDDPQPVYFPCPGFCLLHAWLTIPALKEKATWSSETSVGFQETWYPKTHVFMANGNIHKCYKIKFLANFWRRSNPIPSLSKIGSTLSEINTRTDNDYLSCTCSSSYTQHWKWTVFSNSDFCEWWTSLLFSVCNEIYYTTRLFCISPPGCEKSMCVTLVFVIPWPPKLLSYFSIHLLSRKRKSSETSSLPMIYWNGTSLHLYFVIFVLFHSLNNEKHEPMKKWKNEYGRNFQVDDCYKSIQRKGKLNTLRFTSNLQHWTCRNFRNGTWVLRLWYTRMCSYWPAMCQYVFRSNSWIAKCVHRIWSS